MSLKMPAIILALVGLALSAGTAFAADKTVTVKFPRGSNGTTISDTVRGDNGFRYVLGVKAGQRLSIQLDTSNPSAYFNVTGPGASAAMYNGSIDGNATSFEVPSSGNWVINVYLMRNAARRNERANFDLTLYVENAVSQAPSRPPIAPPVRPGRPPMQPAFEDDGVAMADMPRFCAGEASARFNRRPTEITTNMAFQSGNRYVVQGWFDGSNGTTFFNCWFDTAGNFQSVN